MTFPWPCVYLACATAAICTGERVKFIPLIILSTSDSSVGGSVRHLLCYIMETCAVNTATLYKASDLDANLPILNRV